MKFAVFSLLLLAFASATVVKTVLNPYVWADNLGINTQFPESFDLTATQNQMKFISEIGIKWLRISFHWFFLENTQGNFNWAMYDPPMQYLQTQNVHALADFTGSPPWISACGPNPPTDACAPSNVTVFAERLLMLAKRYPWVEHWEVWNEMNLAPVFWYPSYDPETYSKLFIECTRVFNLAGLGSKLAVGSFGYFSGTSRLTLMVNDIGSLGAYGTPKPVVSFHPYTDTPEGSVGADDSDSYGFLSASKTVIDISRNNWGVENVWATEWGWSSYEGTPIGQPIIRESGQADYTVKRLVLNTLVGYNRTFIFTITDFPKGAANDRDILCGLIRLNYTVKPVYNSISNFMKVVGRISSPVASVLMPLTLPKDLIAVTFQREDGAYLCAFYLYNSTSASLTFPLAYNAILHNISSGENTTVTTSGGNIEVKATFGLQILEWSTQSVTKASASSSTPSVLPATSNISSSNSICYSLISLFAMLCIVT